MYYTVMLYYIMYYIMCYWFLTLSAMFVSGFLFAAYLNFLSFFILRHFLFYGNYDFFPLKSYLGK